MFTVAAFALQIVRNIWGRASPSIWAVKRCMSFGIDDVNGGLLCWFGVVASGPPYAEGNQLFAVGGQEDFPMFQPGGMVLTSADFWYRSPPGCSRPFSRQGYYSLRDMVLHSGRHMRYRRIQGWRSRALQKVKRFRGATRSPRR